MRLPAWNLRATKGWDVKNGSKPAPELRETAPQRNTHGAPISLGKKNGGGRKSTVVAQSPGNLTVVLQTPTVPLETNVKNEPRAR